MLITKSKPKLKLENDLSKKLQFSTDFSQNFTENPSAIALPWQQWTSDGTDLYSEFKPISRWYKSQSLSFLLLTVSAQQREEPRPV